MMAWHDRAVAESRAEILHSDYGPKIGRGFFAVDDLFGFVFSQNRHKYIFTVYVMYSGRPVDGPVSRFARPSNCSDICAI